MSAWKSPREPMLRPFDSAAGADVDSRAALVRLTLAMPSGVRLSEREHALIATLRDDLVAQVEDDMRERLSTAIARGDHPELAASLETPRVRIAGPVLAQAGMPDDSDTIATLLRRLDEDRLVRRIAALREPGASADDPLVGDGDAAVGSAASELLVAEARRADRFGDPRIDASDLTPGARSGLVWAVAAALRGYAQDRHGMAVDEADRLMTDAALDLLAAEPPMSADAAAAGLAALLDSRARLDDRMIADALGAGRVTFFVAALARCAGLGPDRCWRVVAGVPGTALLMLLRGAEMSRAAAAQILALLADDPVALIQEYDAIDAAEVTEALRRWQLDPAYRAALERIGARP